MKLPKVPNFVQLRRLMPLLKWPLALAGLLVSALAIRMLVAAPVPLADPRQGAAPEPKGYIGLAFSRPLTEHDAADLGLTSPKGAVVVRVSANGPAHLAGVEVEDTIIKLNDVLIENGADFIARAGQLEPGTSVILTAVRNRKELKLPLSVASLDARPALPDVAPLTRIISPDEGKDNPTGFGLYFATAPPGMIAPGIVGGATVTDVVIDSVANRVNLMTGDVILRVNGQPMSSVTGVVNALKSIPSGYSARVVYWRGGSSGDRRLVFLRRP